MKILRIFSIGANRILSQKCCTRATVTAVGNSYIHVIKKPIRLNPNPQNTMYSHYIFFTYTVDSVPYKAKLYVDLTYRCPKKGEEIDVYYDPEKPENYACYAFGPNPDLIGW